MKIKLMTALAFAFALVQMTASAQTGSDPTGYVTYSLPQTVLSLEVEAVRETFYAGPYAKYAEKYLGIKQAASSTSADCSVDISCTAVIRCDCKVPVSEDVICISEISCRRIGRFYGVHSFINE